MRSQDKISCPNRNDYVRFSFDEFQFTLKTMFHLRCLRLIKQRFDRDIAILILIVHLKNERVSRPKILTGITDYGITSSIL